MADLMRNARSGPQSGRLRRVLWLVLISLAILTGYQLYRRQSSPYQVRVFTTSTGWGYDILTNKNVFIHQPTIPGQSGMVGFASQQQARRVGERVAEKLQETKALPTLTHDELRQLGVTIP